MCIAHHVPAAADVQLLPADIPANDYVLVDGWPYTTHAQHLLWDILYPQHTENNECVIASTPSVSPVVVHNLEC